jgi:hypothetical protein
MSEIWTADQLPAEAHTRMADFEECTSRMTASSRRTTDRLAPSFQLVGGAHLDSPSSTIRATITALRVRPSWFECSRGLE